MVCVVVFLITTPMCVFAFQFLANIFIHKVDLFPNFITGGINLVKIFSFLVFFSSVIYGMKRKFGGDAVLVGLVPSGLTTIAAIVFVILPYVPA